MKPLTKADVIAIVADIAAAAHHEDDECARVAEDELYRHVLRAIANGTCDDPVGCCTEALKTGAIHFSRWYA